MSTSFFLCDPYYRLINEVHDAAAVQRQSTSNAAKVFRPRLDLHENAEANTITATFELPGLSKENVQIDIHNGRLNISGESKISSDHEENGYAVRERRYGKFSRTLQLPQGVKEDQIRAKMENGVLTVSFPKTTPEMEPKKIAIA